jgi:hypothetical protein
MAVAAGPMGAPLPSIGGLPRSGIRINDPDGAERLGLNLFDDGRMVVGLDAPRGAGDDRNRERINLVADATGGSTINFKDRRTTSSAAYSWTATTSCGWSSTTTRRNRASRGESA